jgi:alkanesulfonate monooxygenase SsuD/methylene tetrahydromethanopterin reductase-like flavin-dependent oxidoreductase (luciferase family)
VLLVAPDLPRDRERAVMGGRLVRYLSGAGGTAEQLPALNGWDPAVVAAIRAHPVVANPRGDFTLDQLAEVAEDVVPEHWIRDGGAVGSAAVCAARVRDYLDAGADEVILHGSVPQDLDGLVAEFRKLG